ncbi:MAG TPA: hypothetical protein VFX30_13105 [bacterium]|nr:hypothetical protein [bacterium]
MKRAAILLFLASLILPGCPAVGTSGTGSFFAPPAQQASGPSEKTATEDATSNTGDLPPPDPGAEVAQRREVARDVTGFSPRGLETSLPSPNADLGDDDDETQSADPRRALSFFYESKRVYTPLPDAKMKTTVEGGLLYCADGPLTCEGRMVLLWESAEHLCVAARVGQRGELAASVVTAARKVPSLQVFLARKGLALSEGDVDCNALSEDDFENVNYNITWNQCLVSIPVPGTPIAFQSDQPWTADYCPHTYQLDRSYQLRSPLRRLTVPLPVK